MFCSVYLPIFGVLLVTVAVYKSLRRLFRKPIDIRNRAVFVTGCDTGFGRWLAERLSDMGVTVFAGCLGKSSLEGRANVKVVRIDVTCQEDVNDAVKFVEDNLQGKDLWGVVNNAGQAKGGQIEWMPIETYQRIMDVNYFGVVRVTKAFLPLIRHARGRVVNIASIAATLTGQNLSVYCSTKAAVMAFSEGLRREMYKFDVTVSTIEPSFFRTHITSTKDLIKDIHELWNNCDESIKSAYGEETLDWCISECNRVDSLTSPHVHLVIDAMVDALMSHSPKDCYIVPKV